jgi:hypothetical protein
MPDKRFDTTPKGTTRVRAHTRVRNGIEQHVKTYFRRVGLTLNDVRFDASGNVEEIDLSPESRPYADDSGYIIMRGSDNYYTFYDKHAGKRLTGGGGVQLTSEGWEEALNELSEYIDIYGISFVPYEGRDEEW